MSGYRLSAARVHARPGDTWRRDAPASRHRRQNQARPDRTLMARLPSSAEGQTLAGPRWFQAEIPDCAITPTRGYKKDLMLTV